MQNIVWNDFYGIDMATTKEYSFGGDALLLAEFALPKFRDNVLDLCTGCGVVPVMMMAKGFAVRLSSLCRPPWLMAKFLIPVVLSPLSCKDE